MSLTVQTKAGIQAACPSPEISAYVDGELSSHDELELEMHLAGCRICVEELNLQKSFLNALGSSLDGEKEIELPADFAKAVVANAESRISGLRRPHERRKAAFICTALTVFSLLALGNNFESTFSAATSVAEKFYAVAASAGHIAYDMALGSTIVFRSLASAFVFDSAAAVAFVMTLFVVSLYIFSRLFVGFRRS